MSKKLHSIVTLFDKPDDIMHAAEETVKRGYKKFDVHTPYPLHGMDQAMALEGTKLPYVSLTFGLLGLGFALFFQWYVLGDANSGFGANQLLLPEWLERYPFVIGGKPLFSLPAFVPVMFEVTVLCAALSTVGFLIAVFCGLPANSHPLHDTEYMKGVSSNRFGLCIEADDPQFNEDEVRAFMDELHGSSDTASIFEPYKRPPSYFSSIIFLGFLASVAIGVSLKTYLVYNVVLYIPPFTWMENQERVKPQEYSNVFKDKRSMQKPVEGTVARGFMPYLYKGQPDDAAKYLVNPLEVSEKSLVRGKEMYQVYCAICHGDHGKGDGRVVTREAGSMLKPPSLHSAKTKGWADGRIYHVIMEGQNAMPSYAKQVEENDRWAIILYIRALQRALDAKETDLQ